MGLFKTGGDEYEPQPDGTLSVRQEVLDRFTHDVLGLGDVTRRSSPVEAVAAMFDLSGFTHFCGNVDPHLEVPEFLSGFLQWLFEAVKHACKRQGSENTLYTRLPFFAKFTGDGVLFLWDTEGLPELNTFNTAAVPSAICERYRSDFLPHIRKQVTEPPGVLRAGVARGRVYSVGDGSDFVGPCINIAARLLRLGSTFSCCFMRRGFQAEKYGTSSFHKKYVLKRVAIRGVGENELIYVRKGELEELPEAEKPLFRDP